MLPLIFPLWARQIRFPRRVNHAAEGLLYEVEFSSTGKTWETSSATPVRVSFDGGPYEVVEIPWLFTLSDETEGRLMRVRVTRN